MTAFVAKEGVLTMNALTTTTKAILLSPMMVFPVFTLLRIYLDTTQAFWFSVYIWQATIFILCFEKELL